MRRGRTETPGNEETRRWDRMRECSDGGFMDENRCYLIPVCDIPPFLWHPVSVPSVLYARFMHYDLDWNGHDTSQDLHLLSPDFLVRRSDHRISHR